MLKLTRNVIQLFIGYICVLWLYSKEIKCYSLSDRYIFTSVEYLLIFIMVPELRYVAGFTPLTVKIINEGYNFNASVSFAMCLTY